MTHYIEIPCEDCGATLRHRPWAVSKAPKRCSQCAENLRRKLSGGENWRLPDMLADEPRQQKAEPAWKHDAGKPRMDLIAPEFLVGTANVLAFGAAKYSERNWEQGMSWGRCFGALMRHMWAWWGGEKADPETGFSHLHHAACCLMFLIAYEERKIGMDDRHG